MNTLATLDKATRMLNEVRTAKDAKQVMDVAAAAKHYAKKHKLGKEAIQHAQSIEVQAGAMLGKFRKEGPKQAGARGRGSNQHKQVDLPEGGPPTAKDLGLSEREDAAVQFLATVAEEKPEEFQKIVAGEKKATQVKREQTKAKALEKVKELPSGKFRVLYADPPWKYGDTLADTLSENYGGAEKHYPAMTMTELAALPIQEKTEDNAVLFLWVTSPMLFECLPVFKAWGFQYKSAFIWDKVRHNMGHYNSVRHELLLVCTRGSCTPDVNKLFDSVQAIERTEHSRKPEEFRNIIDTIYPYGRRVELFARGDVPSTWEKWGAETA